MSLPRSIFVHAFAVLLSALPASAGEQVPLKGTWSGSTVSATPAGPNVVLVVSN